MSSKASIYLDLISEYKGKGAKDAEKSLGVLGKASESLASKLGKAFSVTAITAFAGKAIQLAAAEEKQFKILDNTLQNLGLGFAAENSNKMIDAMYLATGIAKSELIPAYQTLLVATKDVALSQKDLQLALDISAGTGKDLTAVTAALGKAYLGNTTSLKRLGAGLDSALLKSGDMEKITARLAQTFSGDAAVAANTFAGMMLRLKAGTQQATVAIGQGMITALQTLAGNTSITVVQNEMVKLGEEVGNAIAGFGDLAAKIKALPGAGVISNIIKAIPLFPAIELLANFHKNKIKSNDIFSASVDPAAIGYASSAQAKVLAAKAKQAAADKAILVTQKAQTAEMKAQAALKLAGNSDDMQKAELIAALKRDISQSDKDMVNYQLDLLNAVGKTGTALQSAADAALLLREKILIANGLIMLADGSIVNLATAKDPFAGFPKYIADALAQLAKVQAAITQMPSVVMGAVGSANGPSQIGFGAGGNGTPGASFADSSVASLPYSWMAGSPAYDPTSGNTPSAPITVNLTVTADPSITIQQTNAASANGTAVTLNRLNYNFNN